MDLVRSQPWRYATAVVAAAVALLARWLLVRAVGDVPTFITFYPAVMLVALLCGLGPGLLTSLLSSLVVAYFVMPPRGFDIHGVADIVSLAIFFSIGVSFSVVAARYRRTREKAATYQRELAIRESQERARREKEEVLRRYELLAGNSRDIMLFMDRSDGRVLEANEAAIRAYGYTREELLGLTIGDLRAYPSQAQIAEQMEAADERGLLFQTEHRRKDGSAFPVEVSSRGATIGERRMLVSVVRDITERRAAEEALRESEQRLRFHLENTPMAVVEWDKDFTVTRWSGEAERMFGWTEAETVGAPIADLNMIVEEDVPIVQRTMERLTDGSNRHVVSSNRNCTKDGRVIECTWYNSVLLDADGRMASVMSLVLDETERKRAEEALRAVSERERFLADVVETANVAFGVGTADGRLILFNQAFADLTGYSRRELEDRQLTWTQDLTPVEWREREAAWLTEAVQTRQPVRYEKEYLRKDGTRVPVELFVQPEFGGHGSLQYFRAFVADITERREAERALDESQLRSQLMAETAGALLSSDDPQRQVEHLCRQVMERLDCQVFFNFLVDEQAGRLRLNAYAGIPEEEARSIEWLDYGVAVSGHAARGARRIVAGEIQTTLDPRTELVKSYGIQAYAAHPLIGQGRVLGTLSFGTRTRAHFADDELALMKAVADHVAIAIERKRVGDAARAELEKTEFLLEAARAVSDRTDIEGMLQGLTDVILSSTRHSRLTISLWDPDRRELTTVVAAGKHPLAGVTAAWDQISGPTREVLTERHTVVADFDAPTAKPRAATPERAARLALLVPLLRGERVLGLLAIDEPGRRLEFTGREIQVMEAIATQTAVAIENAQLYEDQRRIALTLQKQFIHPLPEIDGLELAVVSETAFQPELIGGDFHDAFLLPSGLVAVLLGDVEGKGVRAAGLSETVRSAVRALAIVSASPSEVLSGVSRMLLQQRSEQFVTALLLVIDPASGAAVAASAGHPPALHLRVDGAQPIATDFGPPLGTFEWEYGQTSFTLEPGDSLLAYTDGASEARKDGRLFGEEGIIRVARTLRDKAPAQITQTVRDAAIDFGGRLRDDLQLIVVKFLGAGTHVGAEAAAGLRARQMRAEIPSDPQHLLQTRHAVRDFLQAHGVDEPTVEELVLCVEEACTNAIRHSGCPEPGEVSLSIRDEMVEVCVRDRGRGLDLAAIDLAHQPELMGLGGRGLYLIKSLADELELANDGGACVRIRKRRAPGTKG
jgi:PAS domain S-box-containing protein